jgi:hypothetical protein
VTRAMRDERQRRDWRDGEEFEVRSSRFEISGTPKFESCLSRFSHQSRLSRLNQGLEKP